MLRSFYVLLRLVAALAYIPAKFLVSGTTWSRKYRRSLFDTLRLTVYRAALFFEVKHARLLCPWSNRFLVQRIVPLVSPLAKGLPGYGEAFDLDLIWLVKQPNRKPSDPLIVYLHGGGYFLQTMPSQILSNLAMFRLLAPEKQRKTSILLLDYKLASNGAKFPEQLGQLDAVYKTLVARGNTNIVLMGDSAGGHLAICYTRQLHETQFRVVPSKLVLISPWVKIALSPPDLAPGLSWHENDKYDMISRDALARKSVARQIFGDGDLYSMEYSPGGKMPKNSADWLVIPNFSSPKHDVFLLLGEDESFRDDILEWAHHALGHPVGPKYGAFVSAGKHKFEVLRLGALGQANLRAYVEPQGVHDSIYFFEHDVAYEVARAMKKGETLTVDDIDPDRFFGISRLVKFYNDTL